MWLCLHFTERNYVFTQRDPVCIYPALLCTLPSVTLHFTQRDSVLYPTWFCLYFTQNGSVCTYPTWFCLYFTQLGSVCTYPTWFCLYFTQQGSVCTLPNVTLSVLYPTWFCLYLSNVVLSVLIQRGSVCTYTTWLCRCLHNVVLTAHFPASLCTLPNGLLFIAKARGITRKRKSAGSQGVYTHGSLTKDQSRWSVTVKNKYTVVRPPSIKPVQPII